MSFDIRQTDDLDRWDDLLEDTPHATPFHLSGFLRVLRDRADATLHPLVGYKGEEPMGLLPVFGVEKGPFSAILSPVPDMGVNYQGPVLLNVDGSKCRRLEKRNKRFVEACLEFADAEFSPNLINVRTGPRYDDVRPFLWNEFDSNLGHTQVIDLSQGEQALLEAFSSDARRYAKRGCPDDCEIGEGGEAEIERIVDQAIDRHEELGVEYPITKEYVVDLWRELPDGVVRPYTCWQDGSVIGGEIVLEWGDTTYGWQAGAKTDSDVPVNDLVIWHIVQNAIERGLLRYDLMGADTFRISNYKSKFAPALTEYYVLRRASSLAQVGVHAYRRFG